MADALTPEPDPPPEGGRQMPAGLLRAALEGAGTFVWEWHVDSDRLGDFDQGYLLLGYDSHPGPATQAHWDTLIHPEDLPAAEAAYQRHVRGEQAVYEHAYRARAADGRWRWLHERGRIVERHPDGRPLRMVGTLADVTERHEAELAASAASQRLRKIAAHVPGALFQHQRWPDGRASFPFLSERCVALFGLPAQALTRDASVMLRRVHPDERERVLASIVRSERSLAPWYFEFGVRRVGDGASRRIRGSATPQREADGSTLWHGYFEDVTDARALEQAQRDKDRAEAANRAKTEFLSRMSHELRTPLHAVLGFAQLMELDERDPLSHEQRRRVGLVRDAGDHLLAMIDDLLDLTRIEAGRLPLTTEAVPLAPLVADALAMVEAAALRQDLRLVAGPAPQGLAALADRTRLRQVLLNLLTNAIKYNHPRGRVQVYCEARGGEVWLHVHDTGIGMTPAELGQLFEPFNRLRHAHGPIEGTGIGLTVTRALVGLMGGRIEVRSTPGSGSTFSVALPAAA